MLGAILAMGTVTSADAGLFGLGGTSWKEEVLLHDGSTILVDRSVVRGGRHEIGQQPPFKEQSLSFQLAWHKPDGHMGRPTVAKT